MLKSLKLQNLDGGMWQGRSHVPSGGENIYHSHTTFSELMEFCRVRGLKSRCLGASIMFSRHFGTLETGEKKDCFNL